MKLLRAQNKTLRLEGTAHWFDIKQLLERADFADTCHFKEEDSPSSDGQSQTCVEFTLERNGDMLGSYSASIEALGQIALSDLEKEFKVIAARPSGNQLTTIRAAYKHLCENNTWPQQNVLRVQLKEFDLKRESRIWDDFWVRAFTSDRRNEDVRIPLRSVYFCKGSEIEVDTFVRILKTLNAKFEAKPDIKSKFNIDTLYDRFGVPQHIRPRLNMLLREECSVIMDIEPHDESLSIKSVSFSEDIWDYRDVEEMEGYLRVFLWPKDAVALRERNEDIPIIPQPLPTQMMNSIQKEEPAATSHISDEVQALEVLIRNKELKRKCQSSVRDGDYKTAAQAACLFFEEKLRHFKGEYRGSDPLDNVVAKLFNSKTGLYHFSLAENKGHQTAVMNLFQGFVTGLRNTVVHPHFNPEKEECLQIIALADFLLGLEKYAEEGSFLEIHPEKEVSKP